MPKSSTAWFTTIASWIPRLSFLSLWAVGLSLPVSAQVQEVEIVGTPQVYRDRVTLRARTKGAGDRPILGLQPSDFSVIVDGQPVNLADWKSPNEATPPPAWVVVLLDFSGSMANFDSSGEAKINGAVNAISEFRKTLGNRAGNTQVSIVPFGVGGPSCDSSDVNAETLNRFSSVSDPKLGNFLEDLLERTPCASTDLYSPVISAAEFLTKPTDDRFNVPEDSNQPEPRLSIMLLSDGFHYNTESITKEEGRESLRRITSSHPELIIHTLGYGLSPEELQKEYELSAPATIADVDKTVPAEDFVDQEALKEIANWTGGVHAFSGDAAQISADLQIFLNALLGEYELDYIEPNPARGSKHTVQVVVNDANEAVISAPKPYRTEVFGRAPSLSVRATMFVLTLLAMGAAGAFPFWRWALGLKKELE